MAYLRKLPSGNWRAEVDYKGVRDSLGGFKTKAEAKEWAAAKEAEIAAGVVGQFPAKTFSEVLTRYETEVSTQKASHTFEVLRFAALRRDFPRLADKRFTSITPDDLREWMTERLKTVKASTVRREHNTLSNVWTVAAKEWRWCPLESPWSFVRVPDDGSPRDRRVHWTEVRRICRSLGYLSGRKPETKQQQVAYAWLLALRTAMRSGELLSVTPASVDLKTRVVTLGKHKTIRYTGRARRVPISKQAARLFAAMGCEFTLTDASRDAIFRQIVTRCGITGLRFHDSRAEALTLLSKKVDVLTLQRISGHVDVNVLIDHYYRETSADIAKRL